MWSQHAVKSREMPRSGKVAVHNPSRSAAAAGAAFHRVCLAVCKTPTLVEQMPPQTGRLPTRSTTKCGLTREQVSKLGCVTPPQLTQRFFVSRYFLFSPRRLDHGILVTAGHRRIFLRNFNGYPVSVRRRRSSSILVIRPDFQRNRPQWPPASPHRRNNF
jgi:hypothetical protein